jgi:hypothetical protein
MLECVRGPKPKPATNVGLQCYDLKTTEEKAPVHTANTGATIEILVFGRGFKYSQVIKVGFFTF